MRKLFLPLFLFSCLSLFITCKKSDLNLKEPANTDQTLIDSARAYFDNYVRNEPNLSSANKSPIKEALWNLATTQQFSIGSVVIVPLDWGENTFIKTEVSGEEKLKANSCTYFLAYKDASDSFHTEVVFRIPESGSNSNDKFSGIVLVQDWQGNGLKSFRFVDGQIETGIGENQFTSFQQEECYYVDWYKCTEGYGCTYQYTELRCNYVDGGGGGGGGDGGPNGNDYGGGGGGNGGIGNNQGWVSEQGIGELCGSYNMKVVGNSYNATITYLQWYFQQQEPPYQNVMINFVESCLSIPYYNISAAEASKIFNESFNNAILQALDELNRKRLTTINLQNRVKELTQQNLRNSKPGSTWSTGGGCLGSVPKTVAQYCP